MKFSFLIVLITLLFLSCNNDDDNQVALDPASTYIFTVEFTNSWNATTHPNDYPADAAWGTFTGLTHQENENILLDENAIATEGLKTYAESGNNTTLVTEINQFTTAEGSNLINQPGASASDEAITFEFTTKGTHPYVTILSKISPSPDWIVAVRNINLHVMAIGGSVYYHVVPYDIGSKSGDSYTASGTSTSDPIIIKKDAPLVNSSGEFEQLGILKISFKSKN